MKKRVLSILLALCMALSLLPTVVFAQETVGQAATEAALTAALADSANDVVKLTADITITAGLKIQHNVTVDLNGHVLRYDEAADPDSIFHVTGGKTLTMTDSRPEAEHGGENLPAGGLITGGKGYRYDGGSGGYHIYYYYGGGVYVEAGASFVLAGGTIYACGIQSGATSAYGGGIYAEGGSVTMTGGAIRNCAVSADYGASGGAIYAKAGSVTMSGGVIAGCSAMSGGGILISRCTVRITGGRIENCKASKRGGGLSVNGHTNGPVSVLDTVISGCEAKRGGGVALIGFAELELGENARITGCTATEKDNTEAGAIEYGAAIYMDLEATPTVNYPGCFLYANGGRVEGSVYVGRNEYSQHVEFKATNAIDHTDGKPTTVFTGDVYCEGDIRGGSFYGSVTAAIPDNYLDWDIIKNFWSNISGGSFYGPVRTEGHVSGGTFYGGLALEKNAKLSGKPVNTGTVINDKTNIPDPNGKPVTVTYAYGALGGTYATQIVQAGETAIRPADPEINSLTFTSWCTSSYTVGAYDFSKAVAGNMTLYARWEEFVFGIIVTDKDGNEVYVTSENYTDVLGDGTVSYTEGGFDSSKIPSEYWDNSRLYVTDEAIQKLLAGEEIPGATLGKLTLNGANLQKIEVFCVPNSTYLWYFPIELKGENQITYAGDGAALDWTRGTVLAFTGDGSLTLDAPGASAVAFGDEGQYYQRSGAVRMNAKVYGMTENPGSFTFQDGSLTIQAGDPANASSGVFRSAETFLRKSSITEKATFRMGNSTNNPLQFHTPYEWESLFDQYHEAQATEVINYAPNYLSLFTSRTVTFDSNGGSAVDAQTVAYGGTIASTVPAKTGYTFAGWYLGRESFAPDTPVTADLALTAHWAVKADYTVVFDTRGGRAMAEKEHVKWTDPVLSGVADPQKDGYDFAGWKCGSTAVSETTTYADLAENDSAPSITLTAQWTAKSYTVRFEGADISGKTLGWSDRVLEGVSEPTKTGYDFAGWKCGSTDVSETTAYDDLAENDSVTSITLTAQWEDNQPPTGAIQVDTNRWNSFLNKITFDLFFRNTQRVEITASDTSGEAVKIEYLLTDTEMTLHVLAGEAFTEYTGPFSIDPDRKYIIYARLTDRGNNVSYISSDGMVLDATAPGIIGIEEGAIYCQAQTVTIDENYVDTVTVNGQKVTLDENRQFILAPAEGPQQITVTDQAKNSSSMTVTVHDGHTAAADDGNCATPVYCVYHSDVVVIAAKQHDFSGDWHRDDSHHWHICQNSGCTIADAPAAHSGSDDGDCTTAVVCACGYVLTEAQAGHTWGAWSSNGNGTHTRRCTVDGCTKGVETESCSGGTATCHSKAICDACGNEYGEIDPNNHDGGTEIRGQAAASCTDAGYSGDTCCQGCGTVLTQGAEIPATGHSGGTATCHSRAICDACGSEYGEIDPDNHKKLRHFPAKAATTDAQGHIEYWYCVDCRRYYTDAAATKEVTGADILMAKLPSDQTTPQTGDSSSFILWAAALFISGGLAIGAAAIGNAGIRRSKRSKR